MTMRKFALVALFATACIHIAPHPIAPVETAAALLKGEIDSVIDVEVTTTDMRPLQVQLRRQAVPLASVSEPRFLDERREIGYLQLIAFQETRLGGSYRVSSLTYG